MDIDLTDTSASKINAALLEARRRAGAGATGAVLTLVIVTDEQGAYDAIRAAVDAGREHPSRMLVVIARAGRGGRAAARLDAEIRTPSERAAGEIVIMRLYGELAQHAESVVLPLLLPESPVVTWWPSACPEKPGADPLGGLSQRRITDAASCDQPLAELARRAATYCPGDTDLSWTRLTTWRTMLAAALDAPYDPITRAVVAAEADNPSAELLAGWLRWRLGIDVDVETSEGPGITLARLVTESGDIVMDRPDGRLAVLSRPNSPPRSVALPRRETAELLAEELRRLDPDDIYEEALHHLRLAQPVAAGS